MDLLKLRFISEEDSFEFEAHPMRLRSDVNQGFVDFKNMTGKRAACLEILHLDLGWEAMCLDGCYPIVTNPLALDYDIVAYALNDTLMQASMRNVMIEQAAKERKDQKPNLRLVVAD